MKQTAELFNDDCFEWLAKSPRESLHAVCTDPPYGLVEFTSKQINKLRNGNSGGVWRIPPKIGGHARDPLPRFTTLGSREKSDIHAFTRELGRLLMPALVPGAHVCIAGHPILQYLVQGAMADCGFEVRPSLMRLYSGFRGGDRPKNAEEEFPDVCVTPRGTYEPWMLFRKPISEKTVAANLRRWRTGGLRRLSTEKPLPEVIPSGRTPEIETRISDHPCLKPQHLLRIIVRALLPLGEGVILDPFMGSGSTVAAAGAVGYASIGIEKDPSYFQQAEQAIPRLRNLYRLLDGSSLDFPKGSIKHKVVGCEQLALL